MIIYLIKCTIAMGVSWLIYQSFLAKQKSFVLNRIYLLTAIIGSTLAPFMALPVAIPKLAITDNIYPLGDLFSLTHTEAIDNVAVISAYSISDHITRIIITISILFAIRFIYRMFKLLGLTRVSSVENKEGMNIAIINDGRTPFSLFNTMYFDQSTYAKGIDDMIFLHEKYHIQQWHSIDRILVELISVVQWMNPFLYLLKRDLIDNHEYAADAFAINQTNDSQSYLSLILSKAQSSSSQNFLLQQFSHSSSIKRIRMITTIQQSNMIWNRPLAFLMLLGCLISCTTNFVPPVPSNNLSEVSELEGDNQVPLLSNSIFYQSPLNLHTPQTPGFPQLRRHSRVDYHPVSLFNSKALQDFQEEKVRLIE